MLVNEGRWLNHGAREYEDADPEALTIKEAGAIKSLQRAKIKIILFIAIIYGGVQIACCFMSNWHKFEDEGTSVDIGLTSMKIVTSDDALNEKFTKVDFPKTLSKWKKIACGKIDFNGDEIKQDDEKEETDEEHDQCAILSRLIAAGMLTIALSFTVAVLLLLVSLFFLFKGAKRDTSCSVALLFLFIFLIHIGMAVLYALLTRGVADMNHLIQEFNVEYDLEPGKVTFGAMYWITVSVNTLLIIAMIILSCSIIPDEDLTIDGEFSDDDLHHKYGNRKLQHESFDQFDQFSPNTMAMGGGGGVMNENTLVPVLLFDQQPEQTPLMGGGYNVRGPENWFSY